MSKKPNNDFFSTDFNQEPTIKNEINQSVNPELLKNNSLSQESEGETALESKFRKTLNHTFNKRLSKHFISGKDMTKFRESLKGSGILGNKEGLNITVRELPKITNDNYEKFKNSYTDKTTLENLYNNLTKNNCNFKSVESNNSLGGLTPLTYLVESSFSMSFNKAREIKDKYDMLKPYIYNYRTINGDGNCFYRAAMFRYLEIMVLNNKIEYLQNITYDVYNSFNSEELKSRLIIGNVNIKPTLTINLLILITDLLKTGNILLAHNILVKSFCICRKFDYAIIFYFRYILYDYIKKNEEKTYMKSFPIKIGNLLPSQYETDDGKFLYELFYTNYLLKFYTDAEKIVIYLTPFVLGVPLNVIIFDDNEEEILQNFKWEEGTGLNIIDEISLLNRKNHYEIVYSQSDNKKYEKIFENYENHQKSVILSDIDKYLKMLPKDNNENLLAGISEAKHKLSPKTMVIQKNNLNNIEKYSVGRNKEENNVKNNIVNKNISNPNIINNIDLINENKINYNNININQVQSQKNDLNPKVKIKNSKNNYNNIINAYPNNNQYEMQNQNNNNIKNNINNNINKNTHSKYNTDINNNQYNQSNNQNKARIIPGQNNGYNNQNNYQPARQNIQPYNNQNNIPNVNGNVNNIYKIQKGGQNLSDISNQSTGQKNNIPQNNPGQNNKIVNSKYSQNINNNPNNLINNQNNINKRNYKINPNEILNNKPTQKNEDIGLKTPGNEPSSKKPGSNNNQASNNSNNQFICKNCKSPLNNNTNFPLCQNCFRNEILNEVYSSYLQYLNQQNVDEKSINAFIAITNLKNEKKIFNLDDSLALYNYNFPNQKFGRKQVIRELKKRLCIACLNDITTDSFSELPCKCRICCLSEVNNYLSFFQDFKRGFYCRCKKFYNNHMMMELTLIQGLNKNIIERIKFYFQNKLDSMCCVCAKTVSITCCSNKLISLENQEYNRFLHSLNHYFCTPCITVSGNKEFFCQICQMNHFLN